MKWIYLSPHLDDAVFSCGGLIAKQTRAGESVEIWTLCAGDPPDDYFSPFALELHERWGGAPEAVALRREEDRVSCAIVNARPRYFPLPDCIYRRAGVDYWSGDSRQIDRSAPITPVFLYPDRESIFGPLHPAELELVEQTAARLAPLIPHDARLAAPLTVGGHVDHRLARAVAERLSPDAWYYADYPYAGENFDQIEAQIPQGWQKHDFDLEDKELEDWFESIAAHRSQLSTFWLDLEHMRSAMHAYNQQLGGAALWAPAQKPNVL